MMRISRSTIAVLLVLSIAVTHGRSAAADSTASTPLPQTEGWSSLHGTEHVLAGRIWSTSAGGFIDPADLISALRHASFVLLGEIHDNRDHHRLQAWVVGAMIAQGRRPAVAFEMFSTDQQSGLDAYVRDHPGDAVGLGEAVGWERTGWPDWRIYEPIAQTALDANLPILAANLSRPMIKAIAEQGSQALGTSQVSALRLDEPLPSSDLHSMRRDLIVSHCHMLPETMIDGMMNVLFARDAFMAATMARGAAMAHTDGAVLIAGNGHARSDRGVPWHLERLAPGRSIVSVGFVEVTDDIQPDDYSRAFESDTLPFDYAWFTPRARVEDRCAASADELKRAKERHERTN